MKWIVPLFLVACAVAQTPKFAHVILVIQENRTADNLFSDCSIPGADLQRTGTPTSLAGGLDLPHTHTAWLRNYLLDVWPSDAKHYVLASFIQPYCQIAQQFGFANRMFQTNQGPSAPAHQFLFSGTSAPRYAGWANSSWYEAENPRGAPCAGPTLAEFIDPDGLYHSLSACMDHETIADSAMNAGLTWRYYAEPSGTGVNLWNAVEGIEHLCIATPAPLRPPVGNTVCNSSAYANVVLNPPQVLKDIGFGKLANITFVTPADLYSDHAGTHSSGGPAWVASIVNAIEASPYWSDTAIIVTWDDWGGWWDHVPALPNLTGACRSYCYGGRVPMLVVSAYTPAVVSNQACDFSCILLFIEHNFNLPLVGDGAYMDAYANGDLGEYFTWRSPRPAEPIRSRKITVRELTHHGAPDTD